MCKNFFTMAENSIRGVETEIYLRCGKKTCSFVSLNRFVFQRHLLVCNKDGPICLFCKKHCTTAYSLFSHWKLQPSAADEAIMEITEPDSVIGSDPCSKLLRIMSKRERSIRKNGSYLSLKMSAPLHKRPTIHSLATKTPDDSSQRGALLSSPARNRLILPKAAPVNSEILVNENIESAVMPVASFVTQPSGDGSREEEDDDRQVISTPHLSHTASARSTPGCTLYNAHDRTQYNAPGRSLYNASLATLYLAYNDSLKSSGKVFNVESQNNTFKPITNSVADRPVRKNALTIEKSGSMIFKVRSAQPRQLLPCSGDEQYKETVFSLGEIEKLAEGSIDNDMDNSSSRPVVKNELVYDGAEQQKEATCRTFSDSAASSCIDSSERLCGNFREDVSKSFNETVDEGLTLNAGNTVLDLQCHETMHTGSPSPNKSLRADDSRKEHNTYNSDSSNDSDNHLVIDEDLPELQPYQHVKNPVPIRSGAHETSDFSGKEDPRLKFSNMICLKPPLETSGGRAKLNSPSLANTLKEPSQQSTENGKNVNSGNTLQQKIQDKIVLALQSYGKFQERPVNSALIMQSNATKKVAFVLQPMYMGCNQDKTTHGISQLAAEKSKADAAAATSVSSEVAAGANSSPSNVLCNPTKKLHNPTEKLRNRTKKLHNPTKKLRNRTKKLREKNAFDEAFLLESNLTVREMLDMLKSNEVGINKKELVSNLELSKKRRRQRHKRKILKDKCRDALQVDDPDDVERNSKNSQEENLDESFKNDLAKSPSHVQNECEIAKDKPVSITEMLNQSQDQESPTIPVNEKSSLSSYTLQDKCPDKEVSSASEMFPKKADDGNTVDEENQNHSLNMLSDDNTTCKKSPERENVQCSEKVNNVAILVVHPSLHQGFTPSSQKIETCVKSFKEVDGTLNVNPIEMQKGAVQNHSGISGESDVVCIKSAEGDIQQRFHVRPVQVVSQLQRNSASTVDGKDVASSSKPVQPSISVAKTKFVPMPNQILKFIPPSLISSSTKDESPNAGPSSKLHVRPIKFIPPASNIPIVWVPKNKNLPSVLFKLPASKATVSGSKDALIHTIASKLGQGTLKTDPRLISASSNSNVKAANIRDYSTPKSITSSSSSNSPKSIASCGSNSSKMITDCSSNSSKSIASCSNNSLKSTASCSNNSLKSTASCSNNSLKSTTSCSNNSLKSTASCNNNRLMSTSSCSSNSISKVKSPDFKTNAVAMPISKVKRNSGFKINVVAFPQVGGKSVFSVFNTSTTVDFFSPDNRKFMETKNHPASTSKNDPSPPITVDYEMLDNYFEDEDIKSDISPVLVSNMQYFKYLKQLKSSPVLKTMVQSTDFFKCMVSTCPYTSNSPRELEHHHGKLHSGESAQCAYCLKIYQNCTALVQHSICFHRKRVYACSLCFYRACSKMHVFSHLQACHKTEGTVMTGTTIIIKSLAPIVQDCARLRVDMKKIFCSYRICPFSTNSISDMAYHIWKHAPLPEFSCFQCNFKSRSALKWVVHLNSHDIFLLHCFYCEFGSNKRLHMLNHLTIKHPDFPLMTYVRTSKHLLFNLECFLNGNVSGEFKYIQNCSNTSHCYCYLFLYHAGGDGNRMLKLLENIKTKNMHFKSLECLYCFHKSATIAKMERHLKVDHCTSSQMQYYPCMSQPLSNSDIQKLFIENQCSDENESLLAERFQKFLIYLKELKAQAIRNYLIFGTLEIKSMGSYTDLSISLPPIPTICHRPRNLAQRIIHSFHTAFEGKREVLHFLCMHCKARMKTLRGLRMHWKCGHVLNGKRFSYQVKKFMKRRSYHGSAMFSCSKPTVWMKPYPHSKFQNHSRSSRQLSIADNINLISPKLEAHVINHDISNVTPAFIESNSQKRKSHLLSSPCDKRIYKKRKLSPVEQCFSTVVGTNFSYTPKCPSTSCNNTARHNLSELHERNDHPHSTEFNSESKTEASEPKISVFLEDYACQVLLPVSYLRNLLNLDPSVVLSNAKDIIINDIKRYYEKI